MNKVFSVAEYILSKTGPLTSMKLQKLVYYSQAWHLAWTEKSLFSEQIEAWRDGPVVPALFKHHKGHFRVAKGFFAHKLKDQELFKLSKDEKNVIDRVISYYGKKDPHWLSQLTHLEDPWKNAWKDSSTVNHRSSVISHQSIFEYYSSL